MNITVSHPPVVAISFSRNGRDAPESFRNELIEAGEFIRGLLESRGLTTRLINAAEPELGAAAAMDAADALVVLGGADIDPTVYGHRLTAQNLYYTDRAADSHEIELVRAAVADRKPVLGICRGCQVINVALGGTLIQDLGSGLHNHEVTGDPWTDHDVTVTRGTVLHGIVADDRTTVRTGHHQAVDEVGDGLRVVARADDGVVEAVEGVDGWVLGLQWHPEEGAGDRVALARLLDEYERAVRRAGSPAPARHLVRPAHGTGT